MPHDCQGVWGGRLIAKGTVCREGRGCVSYRVTCPGVHGGWMSVKCELTSSV